MLMLQRYLPFAAVVQLNYKILKSQKHQLTISKVLFCSQSSAESQSQEKTQKNTSSSSSTKSSSNNRNDGTNVNVPAISKSFENVTNKTKDAYLDMVTIFENRSVHRRNVVEFIYAALKNMESFGVHRDIEVYKALINVMPKGKYIPTNIIQAEFQHYPKQQQCIIDLLEQMEDNGVIPDYEMEAMLLNVFGRRGHPLRKYWRMMYWMPKFKNLSPWLLPNPVPNDTLELAKLAIERMCTVDLQSKIDVYETKELNDSIDNTWIVSGMSPEQSNLLKEHDKTKSIFIEGPFSIWLRNRNVNYFILRADPNLDKLKEFESNEDEDTDDIRKINVSIFGATTSNKNNSKTLSINKRSVHQQNDGTIFAICATGTSTKDSLLSWIRLLQMNGNSVLSDIPILFKLKTQINDNSNSIVPINNYNNIEQKKIDR